MLKDGWFPFIQLLGKDFEKLSRCYNEKKHFNLLISGFLKQFDKNRIDSFTQYWWDKAILNEKRTLIEAGINAYLLGTEAGFINCIKNLFTEIEGIFRLTYFREKGTDPNFSQLKTFIKEKASNSFNVENSLGFPDIFFNYADLFLFKNFSISECNVELSRHSVSHGVASSTKYTQTSALQLILTLDQIYFFI